MFWQQDVYSDAIGVVARRRLGRVGGVIAGSRGAPSARSLAGRQVSSRSVTRSSKNSMPGASPGSDDPRHPQLGRHRRDAAAARKTTTGRAARALPTSRSSCTPAPSGSSTTRRCSRGWRRTCRRAAASSWCRKARAGNGWKARPATPGPQIARLSTLRAVTRHACYCGRPCGGAGKRRQSVLGAVESPELLLCRAAGPGHAADQQRGGPDDRICAGRAGS